MILGQKIKEGVYDVVFENGVKLGQYLQKEDGFFDFWPDLKDGYWDQYMLKLLFDDLEELNKDYREEMNAYFDKQAKEEFFSQGED